MILDSEQVLAHDRFQEIARSRRVWTSWVLVAALPQVSSTAVSRTGWGWLQFPEENSQDVLELVSIVLLGLTTVAWPAPLREHPHLVRGRFGELYPVGRLLSLGDLDRSDRLLACLIGRHLHHAAIVEDADGDVSHRHVVVVRIGAGHRVPDLPGLRSLDQAVVDGRDGDCPRRPVVEREDEGRSECRPPVGADQGAGVGSDVISTGASGTVSSASVTCRSTLLEDLRGTSVSWSRIPGPA